MKIFNKVANAIICLLPLTLASCGNKVQYLTPTDPGTATIRIYKDNNSTSTQRYIAPKNVEIKFTYNDLSGVLANNENVCPSIGDVNLLVIPVHLPGDKTYCTEEVRSDIETMFFSENSDKMGYPSVKEYYYQSSYGKLNFTGVVTEWFDVAKYTNLSSASEVTSGTDGTIITEILTNAVEWAKTTQGIDLNDYDKNQDGSIDAIWLVYDHLDWTTEFDMRYKEDPTYTGYDLNSSFWNFTSWDWNTFPAGKGKEPTTSGFSWASFDMMYTSYCDRDENDFAILDDLSSIKLDSHTFIHETGHLLGLDDYYASDDSYYHPAGQSTMMDQNICDLDSYSKMLLGWVTPYVVYGTSEILIPTATSSDHAVIVIPSNYKQISDDVEIAIKNGTINEFVYEFNPFSEYIMIDLYSPDGLNEIDTFGQLLYDRKPSMEKTGVRIYHVDSRIFQCNVITYEGGQLLSYVDNYVWDEEMPDDDEAILMAISNQKTESSSFQLPSNFDYFDQIRLLEATCLNTFDLGYGATNQTLWDVDSSPFEIEQFGYQFFNANYSYNDGTDLPFKIKVTTLTSI